MEQYALIRAMRAVLTQPLKKFSISDLSKEADMAGSAASYCLDYMLKNKLVKFGKVGRTHQYQANLDNFLARQWKILFSSEEIHGKCVVEHILKNAKHVTSIILYGSVAMGIDDEKSDIDILVIADGKKADEVYGLMAVKQRELNISIYSPMEWRKKASSDKIFYEQVVINSIALYGEKPVVL